MFTFLKGKPYLKDLIPPNHIDFHSHLLPGIDDGAKTFDDTKALISDLISFGCEQFITTPHIMGNVWENTPQIIAAKLAETNKKLTEAGLNIKLRAAAEYLIDSNFVKLVASERLLTLNDNYVLVEMSYINPPLQLYDVLFDLQVAGYIPVLAHPERYSFYFKSFGEYQKLKNAGCRFQINLLSTVGYYGKWVAQIADRLLQAGLIDFAGSDVHHDTHARSFEKRVLIKDVKPLQAALENNVIFRF
ncbi:MAG TPA: CpsB/CapC family capsule biosynthesis tyrosine phosphatase [Flavobacterium sp.]